MPLRALSVAIFLLLALTTAEAIQVVGVLLVLTLVITPAAAAQRLTARPGLALVLSIVIALVATEGGILLSLAQPWPTSFFISAISFAVYVAARVVKRRDGAHVRLEVRDLRGARDRQQHGRVVEQPAELERGLAQPLAERAPREERDALVLAGLQHVLGGEQAAVVLVLHGDDARDRLRRAQLLDRDVRDPDQPDLALVAELAQRADRLLDRHLGIVAVQLVEIDAVELQPPQARLARATQVLRAPVANSILEAPSRARPSSRSRDRPDTDGALPRRSPRCAPAP